MNQSSACLYLAPLHISQFGVGEKGTAGTCRCPCAPLVLWEHGSEDAALRWHRGEPLAPFGGLPSLLAHRGSRQAQCGCVQLLWASWSSSGDLDTDRVPALCQQQQSEHHVNINEW